MKKKKKVEKLIRETLYEVELINIEFKQIIDKTKKQGKNKLRGFELISDNDLVDIYTKRKDRKYAALIIELYALVEQLLKDSYSILLDRKEYKKEEDLNIIVDLQEKLKDSIQFDSSFNTKQLADLRNYIIHDTFSLKQARKSLGIYSKNNKALLKKLLKNVYQYVNSIAVQ